MKRVKIGIIGDGSKCEVSFLMSYIGQEYTRSSRSIFQDLVHKTTYSDVPIEIHISQLTGLDCPHLWNDFLHQADAWICCIDLTRNTEEQLKTLKQASKIKVGFNRELLLAFVGANSQDITGSFISLPILGACRDNGIKNRLCFLDKVETMNGVFDEVLGSIMKQSEQQRKRSRSGLFVGLDYEADVEDNGDDIDKKNSYRCADSAVSASSK